MTFFSTAGRTNIKHTPVRCGAKNDESLQTGRSLNVIINETLSGSVSRACLTRAKDGNFKVRHDNRGTTGGAHPAGGGAIDLLHVTEQFVSHLLQPGLHTESVA